MEQNPLNGRRISATAQVKKENSNPAADLSGISRLLWHDGTEGAADMFSNQNTSCSGQTALPTLNR
jgi:hypothetical protein